MKALIQRVQSANVTVDGDLIGAIDRGLLVFLAVERHDVQESAVKIAEKLLGYRVFPDDKDKMNRSVRDIGGDILLISQFTLAADTDSGLRPSFSRAAPPQLARDYYQQCLEQLQQSSLHIASGQFAADMQVSLINDGPVTFLLSC